MTNKYLTEENVKIDFITSKRTYKQVKEALSLELKLEPVFESGSCRGCFFRGNSDYIICHVLDCDGDNHVFSEVKIKKDFEKVWLSHYV